MRTSTALGILILATAPATQDPAPTSAAEALAAARLATEVRGDPAAAEATLRAALATAGPDEQPALRAELAGVLRRLGKHDEFVATLRDLQGAEPPWGAWAARQLRGQDPVQPGQRRDPLREMVTQLDEGTSARTSVHAAMQQLLSLGALAVPAIIKQLDDFGPYGLMNALEVLCQTPGPQVDAAFEAMLRSEDVLHQLAAADALYALSTAKQRELAELALASGNERVRLGGLRALAESPPARERVLAELGRLAKSPEEYVRIAVVAIVVEHLAPGSDLRPLLMELATDSSPRVHQAALEPLLGLLGRDDEQAVLELYRQLTRDRARRIALWAIERELPWQPLLIDALDDEELAAPAAKLLNRHKLEVGTARLHSLLDDRSWEVRRAALELLAQSDAEVSPVPVTGLLDDSDQSVRYAAIRALDARGDARAVPGIAARLRSMDGSNDEVQRLCSLIENKSDATTLDDVLGIVALPAPYQEFNTWQHKTDAVQAAVAQWFGGEHIRPAFARLDAIEPTVAHLILQRTVRTATTAEADVVRDLLTRSLAKLAAGSGTKVKLSMKAPLQPRPAAKQSIAILGAIGGDVAQESLAPLLAHDDGQIRTWALEALRKAAGVDQRAVLQIVLDGRHEPIAEVLRDPLILGDAVLRERACERILDWPPRAEVDSDDDLFGWFLSSLPPEECRRWCTAILEKSRDPAAVNRWIVRQTLRALGDFRDGELCEVLAIPLRHPSATIRLSAVEQLSRAFDPECVPHLIGALKDDDARVRSQANAGLSELRNYLDSTKSWREAFKNELKK